MLGHLTLDLSSSHMSRRQHSFQFSTNLYQFSNYNKTITNFSTWEPSIRIHLTTRSNRTVILLSSLGANWANLADWVLSTCAVSKKASIIILLTMGACLHVGTPHTQSDLIGQDKSTRFVCDLKKPITNLEL